MRPKDRRTLKLLPRVEGMESRLLLSDTAVLAYHGLSTTSSTIGPIGGGGVPTQPANQYLNPTGTPTAHEAARQKFFMVFNGSFIEGPGRFSDEASTIRVVGFGKSTYFLHGDMQIGIVVPTDRTRPTSGVASSFDRNINTNSVFGFDLSGSTANLDSGGRPTVMTGVTDVNISSGTFVESSSQSTFNIRYFPDGKKHPDGVVTGKAVILVEGYAYTLTTANILGGASSRYGVVKHGTVISPVGTTA